MAFSAFLLEKRRQSRNLPLGHYERKAAEEAVQKEYAACHQQEARFAIKLKKDQRVLTKEPAVRLANFICDETGSSRVRLYFASKDVHPDAAAHCVLGQNKIHFRLSTASTIVLIHELTHHVDNIGGHGEKFLEIERYLFEICLLFFKRQLSAEIEQ